MALLAATNKQVPEHSILDHFDKQIYLGNEYVASASFTVGASEIPLLLVTNVQTGNSSNFKALFVNMLKVVEKTASQSIILNVYINPTVTGAGTPITPVNLRSSYGVTNVVATIASSPSVSSNGTLVDSISAAALTVGVSTLLKILDQGQSILITGIASAASVSVGTILQWYEL
jgi:hypothetical protein